MVKKTVISSAPCINLLKVKELPAVGEPNTVYYVKGNDEVVVKAYITDINGNPALISGTEVLPFNFIDLLDAPNSYANQAGKFPAVNPSETGLIFKDISSVAPDLPDGITVVGNIIVDPITYLATINPVFTYRLNNILVTTDSVPDNTIQLDLPPTTGLARIDIIYGNQDGSYGYVKGVEQVSGHVIPDTPNGTILLAQFFVYEENTLPPDVDIQPISGYYKTTGGEISGPVTITGGNDLRLRGRIGTDDSGDIVFQNGLGVERGRIWQPQSGNKKIYLRFDPTDPYYTIFHSGQVGEGLTYNSITDKIELTGDGSGFVKLSPLSAQTGNINITGDASLGRLLVYGSGSKIHTYDSNQALELQNLEAGNLNDSWNFTPTVDGRLVFSNPNTGFQALEFDRLGNSTFVNKVILGTSPITDSTPSSLLTYGTGGEVMKTAISTIQILKTEYTATGGETTFTLPDLIGRTVLSITRTDECKIVSGTPTGTDIQFNDSTGQFTVASGYSLNTNEYIRILSQQVNGTVSINNGSIYRTVDTYAEMSSMLAGDNPLTVIEYTVKEDETNGGVVGHYTHFNNNLTYVVEGDVTI